MKNLNLSYCYQNITTQTPDIVVVTDKGIFQEKVYLKEILIKNKILDCSNLNGGEWIKVPALFPYTSKDFCVMKFEAKKNGSNPVSKEIDLPWTSITQPNARVACNNLNNGVGNYHLISNFEWMSITRNIEQVNSNWVNSTGGETAIGIGSLKVGNVGSVSGSGYDGLNPENSSLMSSHPNASLGALELNNGQLIWDLNGNVQEWTNDTLNMYDWDEGGTTNQWNLGLS